MFVNECLTQCLPGDWVQNTLWVIRHSWRTCQVPSIVSVLGVNRLLPRSSFGQHLSKEEGFERWSLGGVPESKLGERREQWVRLCVISQKPSMWNLGKCFFKDRLRKADKDEKGSVCLPSLGDKAACILILISVDITLGIPRLSVTQWSFGSDWQHLPCCNTRPRKPARSQALGSPHDLHSSCPSHAPAALFYFIYLFFIYFILVFWLHCAARGILVPWPGIEPYPCLGNTESYTLDHRGKSPHIPTALDWQILDSAAFLVANRASLIHCFIHSFTHSFFQ